MEKYSPENESQKYKIHTSQKCNADLNRVFTALNIYIYYMYIYIMYILQINAIIIKGYVAFYVYRLTHLCRPVRSTFAVRETAFLSIMGALRCPP